MPSEPYNTGERVQSIRGGTETHRVQKAEKLNVPESRAPLKRAVRPGADQHSGRGFVVSFGLVWFWLKLTNGLQAFGGNAES